MSAERTFLRGGRSAGRLTGALDTRSCLAFPAGQFGPRGCWTEPLIRIPLWRRNEIALD